MMRAKYPTVSMDTMHANHVHPSTTYLFCLWTSIWINPEGDLLCRREITEVDCRYKGNGNTALLSIE
ncbi:hypothetical protein DPMN_090597 [Dreissena polymorpha]|uniref:Uncharacterized protein n=1 Tax=Dreissena polymorpha TaxID=45954 RepID=A0A9D4KYW3_DREPO|nr:hypothetical protein DPMN_090597 [Dreissena polymorpha]